MHLTSFWRLCHAFDVILAARRAALTFNGFRRAFARPKPSNARRRPLKVNARTGGGWSASYSNRTSEIHEGQKLGDRQICGAGVAGICHNRNNIFEFLHKIQKGTNTEPQGIPEALNRFV